MLLTLLSIFGVSCKYPAKDKVSIPEKSEIFGLASPVNLNIEKTTVLLADFFIEPSNIDSVSANKNLSVSLSENKNEVNIIVVSDSLKKLSVLDIYSEGYKYSILLKKSDKIKYDFSFDPKGKTYKLVQIKGEMNAWNPNNGVMTYDGKKWNITFEIEPGVYQYKLVVDGKEVSDPANKDSISNNIGGFNSLLKAGKVSDKDAPYLSTISYNEKEIIFSIENNVQEFFVFYQNYQIPDALIKKEGNKYTVKIPEESQKFERSYIRIWAYNKAGISNDLYIPLVNGKVIADVSELGRTDFETAVMYNVFIDRFYDGDESNNRPLNIPEVLPKADYHGGDIAGIIQKINDGYFESLGVNTLWISPIVKNVEGAYGEWTNPKTKFSAYHGYWPVSFTKIDERFGTSEEFKQLVELAHSKNMNVILDFVAHHVHEQHPLYKQHTDWATDLYLPDGSLNTERWDDYRLTTWFDVFLPTLDNSKPEVYQMISDSALFWIKEYNIDGFRHDAAKHVPLVFWTHLTRKIKEQIVFEQNKKVYQIGETYGTHELVGSYVNSGMLDGQFDFNLYDAVSTAIALDNSFKTVENSINQSFKYFGWHNLMGNITGNQDRGRFISYATGTLKYDEDAKLAGWTRDITVGSPDGYKKMALLMAFINTIPGIPVIYYGDEIGMPGGNDPDNRRMMRFDMLSTDEVILMTATSELIKTRLNSMPLLYGDFKFLLVEDDIMVYQRTYFDKIAVVVISKSENKQNVEFELDSRFDSKEMEPVFNNKISTENNKLKVEVEPYSFEIIFN